MVSVEGAHSRTARFSEGTGFHDDGRVHDAGSAGSALRSSGGAISDIFVPRLCGLGSPLRTSLLPRKNAKILCILSNPRVEPAHNGFLPRALLRVLDMEGRRRSSLDEEYYSVGEEADDGQQARGDANVPSKAPPRAAVSPSPLSPLQANARPYRRKSQLGRQLEASVSSLSPIPPLVVASPSYRGGEEGNGFRTPSPLGTPTPATTSAGAPTAGTLSSFDLRISLPGGTRLTGPALSPLPTADGGKDTGTNYLMEAVLKKVWEIESRLKGIEKSLAGEDDEKGEDGNGIGGQGRSSAKGSAKAPGGTQYEVLEGLMKVRNLNISKKESILHSNSHCRLTHTLCLSLTISRSPTAWTRWAR